MKSKKLPKKFSYIQDWGTYSNQTFVAVGMSFDEITQKLRKLNKKVIEDWLASKGRVMQLVEGCNALVWHRDGRSVLFLPEWKNDWQHWDTLNHEVAHLVHAVLGWNKNMMEEDEGRAYQHEFLFREIRRKLWSLTK